MTVQDKRNVVFKCFFFHFICSLIKGKVRSHVILSGGRDDGTTLKGIVQTVTRREDGLGHPGADVQ